MTKMTTLILLLMPMITFAGKKRHHHHDHKKRHHHAHSHGSSELNLATDKYKLKIVMTIPGFDIVGFEHTPKTKAQKNSVKQAISALKNAPKNIELPKSSICTVSKDSSVETEMDHHDHHSHNHKKSEHAEFKITYHYICKNITALTSVTVNVFSHFKNMQTMKAQGITKDGQFTQSLNKKSNVFKLGK